METTPQTKTKKKKAQGPKPGKVVRINPTTLKIVSSEMKQGEPMVSTIERLVKSAHAKKGKTYYILPESGVVCESLPDAKGKAILAAVLKKRTEIETPIAVKEI